MCSVFPFFFFLLVGGGRGSWMRGWCLKRQCWGNCLVHNWDKIARDEIQDMSCISHTREANESKPNYIKFSSLRNSWLAGWLNGWWVGLNGWQIIIKVTADRRAIEDRTCIERVTGGLHMHLKKKNIYIYSLNKDENICIKQAIKIAKIYVLVALRIRQKIQVFLWVYSPHIAAISIQKT